MSVMWHNNALELNSNGGGGNGECCRFLSRSSAPTQQEDSIFSVEYAQFSAKNDPSIYNKQEKRTKGGGADDPDSLIAEAMNSLSVNERDRVYEEVHGVADQVVHETPQFLQYKLLEIDQALALIPNKPAFDRAFALAPYYVQGERIKFLRSEQYDPAKAAKKMVNHFQAKSDLWGEDKIHRPIVLSDFTYDDYAFLKSGVAQVLPARDRSGRALFFHSFREFAGYYKTHENILRTYWYICMAAFEDEETQRRGGIGIAFFNVGNAEHQFNDFSYIVALQNMFLNVLPMHVTGAHFCYSDNKFMRFISLALSVIENKKTTAVHKMHSGSPTEIKYALMSYGIPAHAIPVSDEGTRKVTNHSKWLNRRQVKEEAMAKFGQFQGIDLPGGFDILLGRGLPKQTHLGNLRFNQFLEPYQDEYNNAPTGRKKLVAETIIDALLKSASYRFLKEHSDGYYYDISETSREEVVEKIYQTLRTHRKKDSAFSTSSSSTGLMSKRTKLV